MPAAMANELLERLTPKKRAVA